ncbi:hypothetical protein SCH01S_29_01100 [Sphingomonas changbaiensis NBRC 104936]|uniref:Uncharacterized protein n=1 Tax=Sphingomonas changbaiensis NBRC 104936 TaxID=1219043 RepID=A0A0E9MNU4_9SPHN|nr:hypothetical protein SCH01S_29_01100 [Sphingomonas changbaiensis NBRC 104936]
MQPVESVGDGLEDVADIGREVVAKGLMEAIIMFVAHGLLLSLGVALRTGMEMLVPGPERQQSGGPDA